MTDLSLVYEMEANETVVELVHHPEPGTYP